MVHLQSLTIYRAIKKIKLPMVHLQSLTIFRAIKKIKLPIYRLSFSYFDDH